MQKIITSKTLKIALIATFFVLSIQSCKKDTKLPEETLAVNQAKSEKQQIDSLKSYLSTISHLPIEAIVYNDTAKAFFFRGVKQVTKDRLIEIKAK